MASADPLWLPLPDVKPQQPSIYRLATTFIIAKITESTETAGYGSEMVLVFSADGDMIIRLMLHVIHNSVVGLQPAKILYITLTH